jgi:hypothetical protein
MQRFFTLLSTFLFFCATALHAQTQSIIVVNGGLFGSTDYANTTIQLLEPNTAPAVNMGTVEVTSIQDILIDSNYAYVAMQDSIVKYDWTTKTKVAAAAFGGVSTVKLALYQDKLLVGNFYEFGAPAFNNLRIFDANTLAYLDSVPEVIHPVEDMLILGDYAYIGQNATTASFSDTLGYLLTYDIVADTVVSRDTLNNLGYEIGRLVEQNGVIYALNNTSNTISQYNTSTGAKSTAAAGVDLRLATYGPAAYLDSGVWYFPYDSGIGSYSLVAGVPLVHRVTTTSSTFVFNPYNNTFCVATSVFGNQSQNTGIVYNLQGDSLYSFDVGFSPEALAVVSNTILSTTIVPAQGEELGYHLAPNPARDQITVHLDKVEPVRIEIVNQVGQTVLLQQSIQSATPLDISSLSTGTYWIVVVNQKGRLRTQAFTKQ